MPTAPTSPISFALHRARALVAQSATFQTWTGQATADDAFNNRTYLDGLPAPSDGKQYTAAELIALRPFCVVFLGEYNAPKQAGGLSNSYLPVYTIGLWFEDNVTTADSNTEAATKFWNNLGNVIKDMLALANTDGGISIDSNTAVMDVASIGLVESDRCPPDKVQGVGDYLGAVFELEAA